MIAVGGAATFLALLIVFLAAVPSRKVSKRRLGIEQSNGLSEFSTSTIDAFEMFLARRGKRAEFARALVRADIAKSPGEVASLTAAGTLLLALLSLLVSPVAGLFVVVLVPLGVRAYVLRRGRRRQTKFAELLPDALQLLVSSLRSGYSLNQALDAVSTESEEPLRSEVTRMLTDTRVGMSIDAAMTALAGRMESDDLALVAAALTVQRETGGNLSEILEKVASTIRERAHLARHVKTLTAEGRASAVILTAMPVALFALMRVLNKANADALLHGGGLVALTFGVVLLVIGNVWLRRTVDIEM